MSEIARVRELRAAARVAVVAALVVIASFVASKASRDAVLLSNFDIDRLPLFVGISAVLSLPIALLAGRLFLRFSPDRLLPVLNLISAVLLVGEWWLAAREPKLTAVIVFLHLGSFGAVLVSGFWSIINERFDVRTAKRYVGRIGVGATLGGILGGLIAERTAVYLEPNMILLVLAVLQALCAVLLRLLTRHRPRRPLTPEALAPLASLRTIAQTPLLRNLAVIVVLGAVAASALDFVFKAEVVATSGDGLLRMLAVYHLGTSILTALIQLLLAQRTLRWLGIARTIAALPITVAGFGLAAVFVPGLYPAVIARGAEAITRSSIYRAGYELLFAPLPEEQKRSTKVVLDVGAERIGDLLGAQLVATLVYFTIDSRTPVLVAAVAVGTIALLFATRVPRSYTTALEDSLVEQARDSTPRHVPDASPLRWTSLGAPTMTETGADLTALSLLDLDTASIREAANEPTVHEVLMPAPKTKRVRPADQAVRQEPNASEARREPNASESIRRDATLDKIAALRSRDVGRIRDVLEHEPTAELVPHILPLVAWDEVAPYALFALVELAPRCTGVIVDALLDVDREFTIRRRLPAVLTAGEPTLAAIALWRALSDPRFEVRYRCGRALLELRHAGHAMPFAIDEVYGLVERELSVERNVLRNYRLLDSEPKLAMPLDHGATPLATVSTSTALAHVFNMLALALPPEPVRIAFQSLHTRDRELRATALEYLESALPPDISAKLWPLIDLEGAPERSARTQDELTVALRLSQPIIEARLAALTHPEES
jgi:ATP:ADP antiporter, AAA family